MNMRNAAWALMITALGCATIVPAQAQSQDSQSVSPISPLSPMNSTGSAGLGKAPAAAARGVSGSIDPEPYDPAQVLPDNNTLAGAQIFGLGSLDHVHNVFDPSISLSELGTAVPNTSGQSPLNAGTNISGTLNFDRMWSIYHLSADYIGGETFTTGSNLSNVNSYSSHQQFHNLTLMQQLDWQRWHVVLRDDFTASAGAAFTGTGMGGPGLVAAFSSLIGSSITSFGQPDVPAETIETGNAMRYRNSILGQAEYSFSRRSAFTFAGSYGFLDFSNGGYISSHMLNAQAGYDYLLDPMNSIAILGGYGKIDYTYAGQTGSTTDYMAALAFGRKITGRLAFQAGAGPEQIHFPNGIGNNDIWFLFVNSALTYERRRNGVSFTFNRGLGAGSGVFLGSTANTFSGSAHHEFTRFWSGLVTGGYALNNSLAPAGVTPVSFTDWFMGANLGRQVGPRLRFNFNYGIQWQNNPPSCPVTSCGVSGFQQTFGLTVNWHLRPAGL